MIVGQTTTCTCAWLLSYKCITVLQVFISYKLIISLLSQMNILSYFDDKLAKCHVNFERKFTVT